MTSLAHPRATEPRGPPARRSPFQGFAPYGEDDAEWFFARDTWRETIADYLCAYRISILYGSSGVGKSSVLRAGVLHELRARAREALARDGTPEIVPVVFARWTGEPVADLREAVRTAVAELDPDLAREPPAGSLADVLIAWGERLAATICIILDQFEEYFLYRGGDDGQAGFAAELAAAAGRPDVPAHFLIAIREDAVAKLDRFQHAIPDLWSNLLRIEDLDRDAAREAIEGPIARWNAQTGANVRPEAGLVDAVLDETDTRSVRVGKAGLGVLEPADRVEAPYLQLVMTRLWDEEQRQRSEVLRVETLTRMGGTDAIVRRHFDEVMRVLSRRQRRVAAAIFQYLVTPSGTKIALPPAVLAKWSGQREARVATVLRDLASGERRILRTTVAPGTRGGDATAYEIYHDRLGPGILDWRTRFRRRRATVRVLGLFLLVIVALSSVAGNQAQRADQAQSEAQRLKAQHVLENAIPDTISATCRWRGTTTFAADLGARFEFHCPFPPPGVTVAVKGPSLSYLLFSNARTARSEVDQSVNFELKHGRSCTRIAAQLARYRKGHARCVINDAGTTEIVWNDQDSTVLGYLTFDRGTQQTKALAAWKKALS